MSFLGQQVQITYFAPFGQGTAQETVTVDSSVELNNVGDFLYFRPFDIDVGESTISVAYDAYETDGKSTGPIATRGFPDDGFYGFTFSDLDDTVPDILGVRLGTTDVGTPSFDSPPEVTFDAITIDVDLGGVGLIQSPTQQSVITIDVNFAAPVAENDSANVAFATPTVIDVLANDSDDGTLESAVVEVTGQGTRGTVTANPDGTITYTPDPGEVGGDSFTYTVQDGFGLASNEATVTVTIAPNQPPTATDDSYTAAEDVTLDIDATNGVLSNDSGPESQPLTAALATGPAHGDLVLNADGSFTYAPDPDFNGDDSFTYTTSDGEFTTDPATVEITVTPVNDAPFADNDIAQTTILTAVDIPVLGNDSDIDSAIDSSSITVATGPANGTATANPDGTVTYTPNFLFAGQDSFTYTVADNEGAVSNTATVAVTVALDLNPVTGTGGADGRFGTNGGDLIQTMGGNDTVIARGGDDIVLGGAGRDGLTGGNGDDLLLGGSGNDTLAGGSGLDILVGGPGDDGLIGGSGLDTAIFAGAFAGYSIFGFGTWRTVQDLTGDDGRDTLTSVELLQFDDGFFDARNGQFTEGGFATAEVEALVTSPGFTTDPEPLLAPVV